MNEPAISQQANDAIKKELQLALNNGVLDLFVANGLEEYLNSITEDKNWCGSCMFADKTEVQSFYKGRKMIWCRQLETNIPTRLNYPVCDDWQPLPSPPKEGE